MNIDHYFSVWFKTDIKNPRIHYRYPGSIKYPKNFDDFEFDYLTPDLNHNIYYYVCMMCNQHWYIENAPEQTPFPEFGIKINEGEILNNSTIKGFKCQIYIKAHDGYGERTCEWPNCESKVLLNRKRCPTHINESLYDYNKKNKKSFVEKLKRYF